MEDRDRDDLYSKRVRAGKRTYFFDVKATRASDFYITITESRRYPQGEGFAYEKHKLFLYKEDFDKFVEALYETVDHIKTELMPDFDFTQYQPPKEAELGVGKEDEFGSDLKWE